LLHPFPLPPISGPLPPKCFTQPHTISYYYNPSTTNIIKYITTITFLKHTPHTFVSGNFQTMDYISNGFIKTNYYLGTIHQYYPITLPFLHNTIKPNNINSSIIYKRHIYPPPK
jgi:hypothetical protein